MRQQPLVTSADELLLLDSYLGEYDVAEVHACIVNGDVKTTWEAIRNADLSSIPVVPFAARAPQPPRAPEGDQQRPGGTRSPSVQLW